MNDPVEVNVPPGNEDYCPPDRRAKGLRPGCSPFRKSQVLPR